MYSIARPEQGRQTLRVVSDVCVNGSRRNTDALARTKVLQAAGTEGNIPSISPLLQRERAFDSDRPASGAHLGSLQGFCFCSVLGVFWVFLFVQFLFC